MAILFHERERAFTIHTDASTYQMMVDSHGVLLHLYYGRRVEGVMGYLLACHDRGFSGSPYDAGDDRAYSLDALPQEYPVLGTGDYRAVCLEAGQEAPCCDLRYCGHEIRNGKYRIPGLPGVYAGDGESETLEVCLKDRFGGLKVYLLYGVLPGYDVITRSVRIVNEGEGPVFLDKVGTACLDFLSGDYDLIQFYGRHAMERNFQRTPISHGAQAVGSRRGTSSHQYSPFLIVAEAGAGEGWGGCYGLSFAYSGGFLAEAEKDQYDQTRVVLGIQPNRFRWKLEAGEPFHAPEAILSYSGQGLSGLSRNFHRVIRERLCRGKYKDAPRPVLINNWEATYFDFTGPKIVEIARQAAELGVEMLVLDDGWFGKRDSDGSGLGDWRVNEGKLGGSLDALAREIRAQGLGFGLWVEPEMVSEDSALYRAHPDWALAMPGREPVLSRSQLVLDFSREEVQDHIYQELCALLDGADITYLKWDMNRSIADVWSAALPPDRQGEVLHRYVLGVYRCLERLLGRYPDLLIEGCSGGGGRFDAGMLYYTPQIWCSDNTDAVDRIRIQYGTSFGFPVIAVGSHVSTAPNHQTGRPAPFRTRAEVAMAGSFGYELDLGLLTGEEKRQVRGQIEDYHRFWGLIHTGDYYRLTDPFRDEVGAWQFVGREREETLVQAVTLACHGNPAQLYLRLKGLDGDAWYEDTETGAAYGGGALMEAGIPIPRMMDEYQAWRLHLVRRRG